MLRSKSISSNFNLRKWSKVIQPLIKYNNAGKSLLNFPLDFFYQIQKIIQSGITINLNIPPTLTGVHDNFLYTAFENDGQDIGEIKLTPSFGKLKFQMQVEVIAKDLLRKIKNKQLKQDFFEQQQESGGSKLYWFPFIVMKQKNIQNQRTEKSTVVWNAYQYKKISNIDVNQITQGYIFTKNLTASITRFFYSPNSSKSFAYKIDNLESYVGQKKSKKLWKVKEQIQNSCTFLKIMFENKSFYAQTISLVDKLEKHLGKQVAKLVSDWVIDPYNRYYLVDIKQVELIDLKPRQIISKSLNDLLSTVTCSMCLRSCNQSQITKVLTNKLINKFHQHLRHRGVALSFKINCKKMANICKVCDLCYCLVVEESKLIEAEKKLSQACHFLKKGEGEAKQCEKEQQRQNILMANQLYQWRLFFYLEDIKNFLHILTSQQTKYYDLDTLYLSLQVCNEITHFQITQPFAENLKMKAIKIDYIFSETKDISELFLSQQIRVQVLTKPNCGKVIAEGCIHHADESLPTTINYSSLQRKYKQMLLFNQDSKYCVLGLYIGLCSDGLINTSGLQLRRVKDMYKINKRKINYKSLPAEWMQIIDQNYCYNIQQLKVEGEQANEVLNQSINNCSVKSGKEKRVSRLKCQKFQGSSSALPQIKLKNKVRQKLVL